MAGIQLQMTWQTNSLLKKRKNGPPLGFKNLGNTCYLNAVLQCLTYTPPLANFCLQLRHSDSCDSVSQQDKKSDCPFCLLEKRIVRSLSIDLSLDTPGKIIGGLKTFAEHFRLGRQEDAHEFLRYVIDACHTTCLRLKKLQQQRRKYVSNGGGDGFNSSTVVKEIFGGALQSQDPNPEYKLFATIVHSGFSPDSGHYYAYIKDALGRWYCCNDSYVSVSTLQEVSSEKVYILFFSRTKQRPPILPTKTPPSTNGTRPHDSNGTDTSKLPKSGQTAKSTDSPEHTNNHSQNTNSTTSSSKVDKAVFSPQKKLGVSGNVKKFPNMKIIVHNKEKENNGLVNGKKMSDQSKKVPLLEDKNGSTQNKHVVANGNGNGEFHRNGNGNEVVGNGCKNNGVRIGNGNGNGVVKSLLPDKLDCKRKHEDQKSWKLLGEDHESVAKREELKESLAKEASSFLRNCDWADEVRSFMHAKKLCARENGDLLENELKRKLIAEAKATFTSKIPESLKTSLIKHIRAHVDP